MEGLIMTDVDYLKDVLKDCYSALAENLTCRVPNCAAAGTYSRGLCRSCYFSAARLVKLKTTTWKKMELNGSVGGVVKSQPPQVHTLGRTEWFLKGGK